MSAPVHLNQPARPKQGRHLLWIGGLTFLLAYLAVDVAHGLIATTDLPRPGAADSAVIDYFAGQRAAILAVSLCHLVSAAGLGLFCWAFDRVAGRDRYRNVAGAVAVGALVASAVLSTLATLSATSGSTTAVLLLRDLSFYTGGVTHVVTLGLLVATVVWGSGKPLTTRPVRWLGYVAATCAVLSVLSVGVYYASAFLPLGRVLCMIWTVSAGVSIARRHRG